MAKQKEILYQRQWAETVRLYSGLLDAGERQHFIQGIAGQDVLLAAECRATWFNDEAELDRFIEDIALDEAVQFQQTDRSARGLLALAELNKFEAISNIFRTIPAGRNNALHNDVVMQYITNGNELQIITFLKVLAEANHQLLHRALDRALDLNLIFSGSAMTEANSLAASLQQKGDPVLLIKLICVFKLRGRTEKPGRQLGLLLKERLLKYADRYVSVAKTRPVLEIGPVLINYVEQQESRQTIESLVRLYLRLTPQPDVLGVRLILSRHLNPQVKQLALQLDDHNPIDQETAYQICLYNIQIGNRTAIEFVQQLIRRFDLSERISPQMLIGALLDDPRPQRLEMAYRLIIEYRAEEFYPLKYLFRLLVAAVYSESLQLAAHIVRAHFRAEEQYRYLEYLCCVGMTHRSLHRLTREIALKDLFELSNQGRAGQDLIYIGHVTPSIKKNFNIVYGLGNETLPLKHDRYPGIRLDSYISFKIRQSRVPEGKPYVWVVENDFFAEAKKRYLFGTYFIGQVLNLHIHAVYAQRLLLTDGNKRMKFVLPAEEAGLAAGILLYAAFQIGASIKVRIKAYDEAFRTLVCSLADIAPRVTSPAAEQDRFTQRLRELQQKYKHSDKSRI